jgi:hypothetical protein
MRKSLLDRSVPLPCPCGAFFDTAKWYYLKLLIAFLLPSPPLSSPENSLVDVLTSFFL